MKTKIWAAVLLICTLVSLMSLSSCLAFDSFDGLINSGGSGGGDTYIQLDGGDTYDIDIQSPESAEKLSVSKALLSAVSIRCSFTTYTGWGPIQGESETKSSAGSGVIYKLSEDRSTAYIITNYHVVYDASSSTTNKISSNIKVYLYGMEYEDYAIPAKYVGGSMYYDLAVLEVKNSEVLMESSAMAATIADSDKISVLDMAIAIGNPEGLGISATLGYVNVESEYIEMTASDDKTEIELRVIRTDAAVNGGNSGGGLFNNKGELIGIVNAKIVDDSVDNIGYAIPSNVAYAVAENIMYYCLDTNKESVYRVMMGIEAAVSSAKTEYDKETGILTKSERVIVNSLTLTSAVSGLLEKNDVINSITVDGKTVAVTRLHHVIDTMLSARVGSSVIINITRGGETFDVTVPITEAMLTAY